MIRSNAQASGEATAGSGPRRWASPGCGHFVLLYEVNCRSPGEGMFIAIPSSVHLFHGAPPRARPSIPRNATPGFFWIQSMGSTAWRSAWHSNMRRPFWVLDTYVRRRSCTPALSYPRAGVAASCSTTTITTNPAVLNTVTRPFPPSRLCPAPLLCSARRLRSGPRNVGNGTRARGWPRQRGGFLPHTMASRALLRTMFTRYRTQPMGAGGHGFVCRRTVARGAGCTHARMHASTNARTHARTKRGGGGSWRNGAPHLSQEQAAFDGEAKRQRCPSEGGGNSAAVLPLSLSRLVLGTSRSYGTYHTASPFTKTPKSCATAQTQKAIPVLVTEADWAAGVRGAMQGIDFR